MQQKLYCVVKEFSMEVDELPISKRLETLQVWNRNTHTHLLTETMLVVQSYTKIHNVKEQVYYVLICHLH